MPLNGFRTSVSTEPTYGRHTRPRISILVESMSIDILQRICFATKIKFDWVLIETKKNWGYIKSHSRCSGRYESVWCALM